MTRRIAFAVGDTAGHVKPALAIAEAFEALEGRTEVCLFAAHGDSGRHLAESAGHRVVTLPGAPLVRVGLATRAAAVPKAIEAFRRARPALRRSGARLVIGTGGYASGAVVMAGRSLGLPTALVEPNAVPGVANRLLRRWVDRAYVNSPGCARFFGRRSVVTGTPLAPAFVAKFEGRRTPPPAPGSFRVLVMGASRGEQFLGEHAPALLSRVRQHGIGVEVWHQAGALDAAALTRAYERMGVEARVTPFLHDVADAYGWSHFVIGRAGANTVAELAVAGLPALLIPLGDAALGHQDANAAEYAGRGGAVWCREDGFDVEALAARIASLAADAEAWIAMSAAARAAARPDAARAVVEDCERLVGDRW
jgi:UDP-N-acetylglucosamine--N-acetylmuramyl-(pentapeptide) pyrophosphoryl-undecaprenol N-acetylglucosamine transferase